MRITRADVTRPEISAALKKLQATTFPGDIPAPLNRGWWWLVWDSGLPVAFAALAPVPSWTDAGYLARCGVVESHRGIGLQRKLIAKREAFAKSIGLRRVITTTYNNPRSANNLIAKQYKTYEPQGRWGAIETIYWYKELT
jgi:GNAT superfamily N-acetyltransferase